MKTVAHCVAKSFTKLRNQGLSAEKTSCVGHSLGRYSNSFFNNFNNSSHANLIPCSHICGLMADHLNFRLERIIALDPARPLIRPGNQNRLDTGDAKSVQVIHTNAG